MYMGESVYSVIIIELSVDGYWTSYLVMTPVVLSTGIPVQVTLIWDRDGTPSRPLTEPEGTTRESSQTYYKFTVSRDSQILSYLEESPRQP